MIQDMTTGSPTNHLVRFSVPIVLGNVFQLTYNAMDSIIVGRFAGDEALAAVGTTGPVMNIIILGVSGLCIGASVLMSAFFGAQRYEKLRQEFAALLILGLSFALAVLALGLPFAGVLLRVLQVPQEILGTATSYLRVVLLGMPFTVLYNVYSSAMRSVGDSKTAVRFLVIASVLNVALDFWFVAGLGWGAFGAGLGTSLAQSVSAVLCMMFTMHNLPLLHLGLNDLKLDKQLAKETLQQGGVTALQQTCQPVGKLLIQICVNRLGISAIAVFNAVSRIDDFVLMPEQSISHAMMTFVSQNRGANKPDRMRQGLVQGLAIEGVYGAALCLLVLTFRNQLMTLFVGDDPAAVALGASYLFFMAFAYLLPAMNNGMQGFCRGLGDMRITLVATVLQITVRVLVVYALVPHFGLAAVAWASAAGWVCMFLVEMPYVLAKTRHLG